MQITLSPDGFFVTMIEILHLQQVMEALHFAGLVVDLVTFIVKSLPSFASANFPFSCSHVQFNIFVRMADVTDGISSLMLSDSVTNLPFFDGGGNATFDAICVHG